MGVNEILGVAHTWCYSELVGNWTANSILRSPELESVSGDGVNKGYLTGPVPQWLEDGSLLLGAIYLHKGDVFFGGQNPKGHGYCGAARSVDSYLLV